MEQKAAKSAEGRNFSGSKFAFRMTLAASIFTPKALHTKAQGRERSERTLGREHPRQENPERVPH